MIHLWPWACWITAKYGGTPFLCMVSYFNFEGCCHARVLLLATNLVKRQSELQLSSLSVPQPANLYWQQPENWWITGFIPDSSPFRGHSLFSLTASCHLIVFYYSFSAAVTNCLNRNVSFSKQKCEMFAIVNKKSFDFWLLARQKEQFEDESLGSGWSAQLFIPSCRLTMMGRK